MTTNLKGRKTVITESLTGSRYELLQKCIETYGLREIVGLMMVEFIVYRVKVSSVLRPKMTLLNADHSNVYIKVDLYPIVFEISLLLNNLLI